MKNKKLVLMRGWPGSGKSTCAKKESVKFKKSLVLSTDDYFVCPNTGDYIWVSSLIGEAHVWNRKRTEDAMKRGKSPIFIDNTNIRLWEMDGYLKLAKIYGYETFQFPCSGNFENTHGVPREKVEQMKDSYEISLLPMWETSDEEV